MNRKSPELKYFVHSALLISTLLFVYFLLCMTPLFYLKFKEFFVVHLVSFSLTASSWLIMFPALKKNPKDIILPILSLTTTQILLFLAFTVAVLFTQKPMEIVFHALVIFLIYLIGQTTILVKLLNSH